MHLLHRLFRTRFQAVVNWKAGLIFGTLASLPFIETLLYNAHIGPGRRTLEAFRYLQIALLCVILWALMVLSFVVERAALEVLQQSVKRKTRQLKRALTRQAPRLLYLLPLSFLLVFFLGERKVPDSVWDLVKEVLPLTTLAGLGVELVVAVGLVWLIAWLIGATVPPGDLSDTMNRWAFGIRMTCLFYVLLIASTWALVSVEGILQPKRLDFVLAIAKDYLLMFIIVDMLFIGVFRLGDAHKLAAVFQSVKGFIQFMVVCAIIAILAIWASFKSLGSDNFSAQYGPYSVAAWQWQYNTVHVYFREIGLLLMPIAGLLFWGLRRVGEELKDRSNAGAKL